MEVSTIQFINQMLLANFSDDQTDPQVKAEMAKLLIGLQKTVVQQQTLLRILQIQQQNQHLEKNSLIAKEILIKREESSVQQRSLTGNHRLQELLSQSFKNVPVKQEHNEDLKKTLEHAKMSAYVNSMIAKRESSLETAASPGNLSQKTISRLQSSVISEKSLSEADEDDQKQTLGMIRRNGFKAERQDSSEQDLALETYQRRCNKSITPKRPPSKAKHLWINYGRKIIEFAMNNTQDQVQEKVKQLVGKLSSKKDFEDVFSVKQSDNECDKLFKTMLGKLALFFIRTQADAAFEGSKYREQMILQKSIVATWISKLVDEAI